MNINFLPTLYRECYGYTGAFNYEEMYKLACEENNILRQQIEALKKQVDTINNTGSIETLYLKALNIYNDNSLTWDDKYDKIFSNEISMKVDFSWYDPDTSYEEDVTAFINAFTDHMKNRKS